MTDADISPASLLLVDDDPLSLELLQGYLEPVGYQLTVAHNGEEAWELLCDPQQKFDLVISDRAMPRMNGMELLRRIKAEPRLGDLPVIFETALAQQSDIAEGIAAGVHYYLTKPFNFRLLQAVVKAALDDYRQRLSLNSATRRAASAINLLHAGRFCYRTPQEARELSSLLAAGVPNPDSVAMGLSELLLNAVEHGNLEIGYHEKGELLISGQLHTEIQRRLEAAPWSQRVVAVELERDPNMLRIRIEDQGVGFDPTEYLTMDPERALDPNGRGIALARQISFSSLDFEGRGNVVVATVGL